MNYCVKKICRVGSRHKELGLPCQDRVSAARHGSAAAIVLADGAGLTPFATLGAGAAAETLAQHLAHKFHELYALPEDALRYDLIATVRKVLYSICDMDGNAFSELGSTCVAAAADTHTGLLLLFHLGDGFITARPHGGDMQVISYPANGINSHYTLLTTTQGASEKAILYRGELGDLRHFCIFSDGWNQGSTAPAQMYAAVEDALETGVVSASYTDDVSAISLELA